MFWTLSGPLGGFFLFIFEFHWFQWGAERKEQGPPLVPADFVSSSSFYRIMGYLDQWIRSIISQNSAQNIKKQSNLHSKRWKNVKMFIYLIKCRIFGDAIWGFNPVLEAGLHYLQLNMFISKEKHNNISFSVNPRPHAVPATVPVSRSINGTDCCPMILTMTALVSSWTGSSSHLAVLAGNGEVKMK